MRSKKIHIELPVIIGSSSKVNGELEFASEVLIEGEAFGKITSEKLVTIGGNGFFKGILYAKDLEVFGRFHGDIIVAQNVVFHSNCTIEGRIYTKYIDLKVGANVNARIIMTDNPKEIYDLQIRFPQNESVTEVSMKRVKRDQQPTPNPGSFFAKVFQELDSEIVTAQINSSTSTDLNQ